MNKLPLIAFMIGVTVVSCKPWGGSDSSVKSLKYNLALESNEKLKGMSPGQCLVEFGTNFSGSLSDDISATKTLDLGSEGACLPVEIDTPEIAWRGRLDVERKEGPQDLSIAILVDSSGSLVNTDPKVKRRSAVINLLRRVKNKYKGYYGKVRIAVISFKYCINDTVTYTGNSASDFNRFINKLDDNFFKSGGETNYLEAMQLANTFLASGESDIANKHLLIFSDGMPWMQSSEVFSQNQNECAALSQNMAEAATTYGANFGLDLFLNGASHCFKGYNPSSCAKGLSPDQGISGTVGVNSSLDPSNIRMAMLQHIEYAKNVLHPSGISVHTVYLKSGECWEVQNSKNDGDRAQFKYLCDSVTTKDFFPALVSGSQGLSLTVKESQGLDGAFGNIWNRIEEQMEFDSVSYTYNTMTNTPATRIGDVCNQAGGSGIACPLLKGEAFQPASGKESGMYNVHLPFEVLALNGRLNIESRVPGKANSFAFAVNYNLPTGVGKVNPIGDCGFKGRTINKGYAAGYAFKDYLAQRVKKKGKDTLYRISCVVRQQTAQGCLVDDGQGGDLFIPNGSKYLDTERLCYDQVQCGQTLTQNPICVDGGLVMELTCPAGFAETPCVDPFPNGAPEGVPTDVMEGIEPPVFPNPTGGVTEPIRAPDQDPTVSEPIGGPAIPDGVPTNPTGTDPINPNEPLPTPPRGPTECPATPAVNVTGVAIGGIWEVPAYLENRSADCEAVRSSLVYRCAESGTWILLNPEVRARYTYAGCSERAVPGEPLPPVIPIDPNEPVVRPNPVVTPVPVGEEPVIGRPVTTPTTPVNPNEPIAPPRVVTDPRDQVDPRGNEPYIRRYPTGGGVMLPVPIFIPPGGVRPQPISGQRGEEPTTFGPDSGSSPNSGDVVTGEDTSSCEGEVLSE